MKKRIVKLFAVFMAMLMVITMMPVEEMSVKVNAASVSDVTGNRNRVGTITTYSVQQKYDSDTDSYSYVVTDMVFNGETYQVSDSFTLSIQQLEKLVGETVVVHIYNGAITDVQLLSKMNSEIQAELDSVLFSYSYDKRWFTRKKMTLNGCIDNNLAQSSWAEADVQEVEDSMRLMGYGEYDDVSVEFLSSDVDKLYFKDGIVKTASLKVDVAESIAVGERLDLTADMYINTDYEPENGTDTIPVEYNIYCGSDVEVHGEFEVIIENVDYDPFEDFETITLDELFELLYEKIDEYHPELPLKSKEPLISVFTAATMNESITEMQGLYDSFRTLQVAIDANNMVCKANVGGLVMTASDAYLEKLFESIESEAQSLAGYTGSAIESLMESKDFKDYVKWYQAKYGYVEGYYKTVEVHCPTDVTVADEDGNTVLTIINDEIELFDDLVYAYVYEGEKIIYLPTYIDYNIEISATDDGTMDYIVSALTPGGVERIVTYDDVAITKGTDYNSIVTSDLYQSADIYNLVSSEGEVIEAKSDTLPPIASDVTDVVVAEELFADFPEELITLVATAMFGMEAAVSIEEYMITLEDTVALFSAVSKYYPIEYSLMVNGDFSYRIVYNTKTNYITKIHFDYGSTADLSSFTEKVSAVKEKIEAIVELTEGMSDFEKALYIHDYIVLNCKYDTELLEILETEGKLSGELVSERYTEYSALVNGTGICGSYALAYRAVMNAAGVECVYVSSSEMNHAWNMVRLDGQWYHVDCCWDDPVPDSEGKARRTFFLRTDKEMMALSHYSWTPGQYKATSEKYSEMPRNYDYVQKYDYDNDCWYYLLGKTIYKTDKFGKEQTVFAEGITADSLTCNNGNVYYADGLFAYEYSVADAKGIPIYYISQYDAGHDSSKAYIVNFFVEDNTISYYKYVHEYYYNSEEDYGTTPQVTYVEDELKRELFESITGITLNSTELELTVFETAYIYGSIQSDLDVWDLQIEYSSSDDNIVSVDRYGTVTAHNAGEAVITARFMEYTAECVVTVTGDGFSGSCGSNIKWSFDTKTGTLSLNGSGAMPSYSSTSSVPWYNFREQIKNIVLSTGITTIGKYAFSYCSELESMSIPQGVTLIGERAFNWCSSLSSVSIPDTVTKIDMYAFYGCTSLDNVKIPDGIDIIWNYSFGACYSLKSISIPESVVQIAQQAFFSCESLETIALPSNLKIISQYAFGYCESLKSVTIPASVTYIYDDAFRYCSGLESITVDPQNTVYSSDENGVLFNKDKTKLMHYPASCTAVSYNVPSTVTTVNSYAFAYAKNTRYISIPDSVTTLGSYAFREATGIKEVTIGNGISTLPSYSFYMCNNLGEIVISPSVTSIGSYAFGSCSALAEITIPDSVTTMGSYAFSNCSSLREVVIPNSVTSLSYGMFSGCTSLESATLNSSMTSIPSSMFYGCCSLKDVVIPSSVTNIENSAFANCTALESIIIPDSVTNIGYGAFENCSSVKYAVIPTSIQTIASYAFDGCTELIHIGYKCSKEEAKNMEINSEGNSYLLEAPYIHYEFDYETDVVFKEEQPADCTHSGHTAGLYCTECQFALEGEVIEAKGHKYELTQGFEGSCTELPYKEYTCSECSDSYTDYGKAHEGHSYISTIVQPTCTSSGYTMETCTLCGETVTSKFVNPTGHKFAIVNSAHYCEHHGTYQYCCLNKGCDYSECITIDASELETETGITEATCETYGTKKEICTHCKATISTEILQPTGHTVVVDKGYDATDTKDGLTDGTHCSVCNKVLIAQEVILAIGQDNTEFTENDSTSTDATESCSTNCNDSELDSTESENTDNSVPETSSSEGDLTQPSQTDPTKSPTTAPVQTDPTEPPTTAPVQTDPTESPTTAPVQTYPTEPPTTVPVQTDPTEPPTTVPVQTDPTEPPTTMPVQTDPTESPTTVPVQTDPTEPPTSESTATDQEDITTDNTETGEDEQVCLGDVDLDGKVSVKDATAIQKHLAQFVTLSEVAMKVADVNKDGKVNIKDATHIQKFLAQLIDKL